MAKGEYPKRFHRYIDGDFVDTKEAKDAKEEAKLIQKGYFQKQPPTTFPKAMHMARGGKLITKIVKDAEAEKVVAKAGFGPLPTQAKIEASAGKKEKASGDAEE